MPGRPKRSAFPDGQRQEPRVLVGVRRHAPARTGQQRTEIVLRAEIGRGDRAALARGERGPADRVEQREHPTGTHHPRQLTEIFGRVGQVLQVMALAVAFTGVAIAAVNQVNRAVASRQPVY